MKILNIRLSFSKAEDRFCFLADWYDAQAAINKRFQLLYYPADNSVEMVSEIFFLLILVVFNSFIVDAVEMLKV